MWTWQVTSLYLQIRPADNCLLPLLPRVTTVCVCLQKECVWSRKGWPLFENPPKIMSMATKNSVDHETCVSISPSLGWFGCEVWYNTQRMNLNDFDDPLTFTFMYSFAH